MSSSCPLYDTKCFLTILPISSTETAFTSLAIDTIGYEWCSIYFSLGAVGAADFQAALSLEECATSGGSYAAVSGSGGATPSQTSDGGTYVWHIDLRKRTRFLKVIADPGAAATLGSAIAILSRAHKTGTSATERGATAEVFVT